MEDKTQLHKNIISILEVKARQTGKSLDEVIKEDAKELEERRKITTETNKYTKKFSEIIAELNDIQGQNTNDFIKKAFEKAGLKMPFYQRFISKYNFKGIKENDILIFNMDYTKLDDKDIYLISNENHILYGEYNKENDIFILNTQGTEILKNNEKIEVLGVLTKVEREFDI